MGLIRSITVSMVRSNPKCASLPMRMLGWWKRALGRVRASPPECDFFSWWVICFFVAGLLHIGRGRDGQRAPIDSFRLAPCEAILSFYGTTPWYLASTGTTSSRMARILRTSDDRPIRVSAMRYRLEFSRTAPWCSMLTCMASNDAKVVWLLYLGSRYCIVLAWRSDPIMILICYDMDGTEMCHIKHHQTNMWK